MARTPVEGKIIQQDYDDLIATGEGSSLFCLSDRTVKLLLATTDFLGWKTRYFSLTDAEIDQDIIDGWQGTVVRELILGNCCCGGQPLGSRLRWSKVGGLLEISYDNGETWIPYPEGDTRQTGNFFPPIPGDDSEDKRCAAANNLTNEMRLEWDELLDQLATIETVLAFSSAVSDLLIPFGIVSAAPGLVFTILTALFAAGQTAINDALTEEQFDKFFCCCYDAIGEDGAVTEAVWDAIGECMGAEMEATAALAVGLILYAAGPIGTHNMAQTGTGEGHDCAACSCEATDASYHFSTTDGLWEYEFTYSDTGQGPYASLGYPGGTGRGTYVRFNVPYTNDNQQIESIEIGWTAGGTGTYQGLITIGGFTHAFEIPTDIPVIVSGIDTRADQIVITSTGGDGHRGILDIRVITECS